MKTDSVANLEVVIHSSYGGFHLDMEMALWLVENRNWKIGGKDEWNNSDYDIIESGSDYYFPTKGKDTICFRSNKDLIDCVRALKEQHKDDKYPESWYGYIHKLKIVKLSVFLGVEDYDDGKEKINCHVEEEFEED